MKKTVFALTLALATALPWAAFGGAAVGSAAPDFTLSDLQGKQHSLSEYKGKYIVLEWNNPQCPFVKKHYDSGNMQKLQKDAASKGAVWLTINSSAPGKEGNLSADELTKWSKEKNAAPTAYLLDPDGKAGHAYGATATPGMFIIDPKGKLVYSGAIDSNPSPRASDIPSSTNYVKVALDESMSGKPVTKSVTKPYGCHVKY